MQPRCFSQTWTLAPFLYPSLLCAHKLSSRTIFYSNRPSHRHNSTATTAATPSPPPHDTTNPAPVPVPEPITHTSPSPSDYALTPFTDTCLLTIHSGPGGHGCISFLREKYIEAGPANGGDGGSGGNVYIQATPNETSLHKLARRRIVKAGRGQNGRGKGKGGVRGEDVVISVPLGTVVREVERWDPVAEELAVEQAERRRRRKEGLTGAPAPTDVDGAQKLQWRKDKFLLHPSSTPSEYLTTPFPSLPRTRLTNPSLPQPTPPIHLDLDNPTTITSPFLLAAGGRGGLGNPHFHSRTLPRPSIATKGEAGMTLRLELELKLLADVGLVGAPNAGKSTLLRALTNARARVGDWAFTTLAPNVGTVVLDDNRGRRPLPLRRAQNQTNLPPRERFSVADIPGLIKNAHLDKGLGLDFLRHVERARVLALVVDLAAGDAVEAVKSLWQELRLYEAGRRVELGLGGLVPRDDEDGQGGVREYTPPPLTDEPGEGINISFAQRKREEARARLTQRDSSGQSSLGITNKPWFVVGTKAELPGSRENFEKLQMWLGEGCLGVRKGGLGGGSGGGGAGIKDRIGDGIDAAWGGDVAAFPVCAKRREGMDAVVDWTVGLLEEAEGGREGMRG